MLYFPLDHVASFPRRSFNKIVRGGGGSCFFLNGEPNSKRYLSWAGCPGCTGFNAQRVNSNRVLIFSVFKVRVFSEKVLEFGQSPSLDVFVSK